MTLVTPRGLCGLDALLSLSSVPWGPLSLLGPGSSGAQGARGRGQAQRRSAVKIAPGRWQPQCGRCPSAHHPPAAPRTNAQPHTESTIRSALQGHCCWQTMTVSSLQESCFTPRREESIKDPAMSDGTEMRRVEDKGHHRDDRADPPPRAGPPAWPELGFQREPWSSSGQAAVSS